MAWILGVDAGGSFSRAVVWETREGVVFEGHGGAGNPAAVGPRVAFAGIEQAVVGALGQAGLHAHELAAGVLGVAGIGRRGLPAEWNEALDQWRIPELQWHSDLEIAHFGSFAGGPGIQIVAGTGSAVLVRTASGNTVLRGGWGWAVGDSGSAVDLGRRAAQVVTAAWDLGLGERENLVPAVLAAWSVENPGEWLDCLYGGADIRGRLAQLAPVVTRLAGIGDPSARAIVEGAMTALAGEVREAANAAGLEAGATAVGQGGVLRAACAREALEAKLDPDFRFCPPRYSALAGAALMAAESAGEDLADLEREILTGV